MKNPALAFALTILRFFISKPCSGRWFLSISLLLSRVTRSAGCELFGNLRLVFV
jgi:ABC-type transport system involved in multi-copper enzyme maturation permease subunit